MICSGPLPALLFSAFIKPAKTLKRKYADHDSEGTGGTSKRKHDSRVAQDSEVTVGTSTIDLQLLAARCPRLGGHTLPAPQIHAGAQHWKIGAEFSMKDDDPYRMKEKPSMPTFIEADSSTERQDHVIKRELDIKGLELARPNCPYQGELIKSQTFAWEFDNVLTEEQCF